jgi:hypothetical protein
MRVIDCDWGEALHAANDEELKKVLAAAYEQRGEPLAEEEVKRIVSQRAYSATDS